MLVGTGERGEEGGVELDGESGSGRKGRGVYYWQGGCITYKYSCSHEVISVPEASYPCLRLVCLSTNIF